MDRRAPPNDGRADGEPGFEPVRVAGARPGLMFVAALLTTLVGVGVLGRAASPPPAAERAPRASPVASPVGTTLPSESAEPWYADRERIRLRIIAGRRERRGDDGLMGCLAFPDNPPCRPDATEPPRDPHDRWQPPGESQGALPWR